MATIKEVAKKARVSVGTVSNVISGVAQVSSKRRERVLSAIRELDYHTNYVARSLKLRRTLMIGMIISDITNPFFSQLVRGAEEAALERNYLLLTFNTDDRVEREKRVLAVLKARRVDGILLVVAPDIHGHSHIKEFLAEGFPVVCLDRVPPKIKLDCVTVDNIGGAYSCVRHLIQGGHRKIGIITGSLALQTADERLQGYRRALTDARIPVESQLLREGDFRAETGYQAGIEMLTRPERPSALFVCNGMMGLGVVKAIEELGLRCPQDIAIAVFDDHPLAKVLRPHLTCVAQPDYLIGYQGTELLVKRIEAKYAKREAGKPVTIRLPFELKIRESTAGSLGPTS